MSKYKGAVTKDGAKLFEYEGGASEEVMQEIKKHMEKNYKGLWVHISITHFPDEEVSEERCK